MRLRRDPRLLAAALGFVLVLIGLGVLKALGLEVGP